MRPYDGRLTVPKHKDFQPQKRMLWATKMRQKTIYISCQAYRGIEIMLYFSATYNSRETQSDTERSQNHNSAFRWVLAIGPFRHSSTPEIGKMIAGSTYVEDPNNIPFFPADSELMKLHPFKEDDGACFVFVQRVVDQKMM